MTYAVGSLVKARGREWVVLPESEEDLLVLRPLGGTEDEVASVYLPLEPVEPATFDLPDPTKRGAHNNWQACGYEPSVAGGRPRSRPKLMVADRAYEAGSFRSYLRRRDIRCVIPEKRVPAGKRRGRPPTYLQDNLPTAQRSRASGGVAQGAPADRHTL